MIAMKHDDFGVVRESLSGERAVDEEVLTSVAVLAERLRRLQMNDGVFSGIELSPEFDELASRELISAIC